MYAIRSYYEAKDETTGGKRPTAWDPRLRPGVRSAQEHPAAGVTVSAGRRLLTHNQSPRIGPRCVERFQIRDRGRTGEGVERTANRVQTPRFFGLKKGFRGSSVDARFPLQYDDFPCSRALSSAGWST